MVPESQLQATRRELVQSHTLVREGVVPRGRAALAQHWRLLLGATTLVGQQVAATQHVHQAFNATTRTLLTLRGTCFYFLRYKKSYKI